jgi:hypothetical protein
MPIPDASRPPRLLSLLRRFSRDANNSWAEILTFRGRFIPAISLRFPDHVEHLFRWSGFLLRPVFFGQRVQSPTVCGLKGMRGALRDLCSPALDFSPSVCALPSKSARGYTDVVLPVRVQPQLAFTRRIQVR